MRHVSLFSGIGGLDLAAEWAGFETVLFVEKDPYCQKVLARHWPGVPIIDDIRSVNRESIDGPIDVLSGGFPCQPHSLLGKRKGVDDARYLWPEMYRVIQGILPAWGVVENVLGALYDGTFDTVCSDMARAGYENSPPLVFPAATFGAPHIRYRVFLVSHLKGIGRRQGNKDAGGGREGTREAQERVRPANGNRWPAAPDVLRVAHGVPSRVDRVKALGNAVVPQQAYPIFAAIAAVEGGRT